PCNRLPNGEVLKVCCFKVGESFGEFFCIALPHAETNLGRHISHDRSKQCAIVLLKLLKILMCQYEADMVFPPSRKHLFHRRGEEVVKLIHVEEEIGPLGFFLSGKGGLMDF